MEPISKQINQLTETLEALLVERNRQIVQAANDGENLASIGRRYGLTRQRVMVIVRHFAALEAAGVGDE